MFREKSPKSGYFSKDIAVKKSSVDGLGVFAKSDISAYTCFEAAPYLGFATTLLDDWFDMNQHAHLLKHYVFHGPGGIHALALGNGSIYNHSAYPNAFWKFRDGNDCAILFYAKRDIIAGEEIFIKYSTDSSRLMFLDEKEIERLSIID